MLKAITALAVVAFIYGVIQLFVLRFDAGDIYPPYSTLRADPVGTKAFYEALSELPGMNVERNYFPMRQLKRFADSNDTTLMFLGCDASTGIEDRKLSEVYRQENQTWDDLLKFVSGGGRLVLTFSPTDSPAADAVLKARLGASVNGRSLAGMNTSAGPRAIRDGAEPSDASAVSWHATTYFDELSPEWATLYSVEGKPVIIERKFDRGSVVLAADSYFISNEAMLNEPHADLLSQIVGTGRQVVFDETHLGVQQEAGIASLVRQYNLTWLVAAMLIITALFIWRSAASFIPRSEAGGKNLAGASVAGRSSVSGLVHLISRAVPLKDLIWTCVNEFLHNRSAMPKDTREKIIAMADAERQARKRSRNTVGTYRRIVSILQERK